MALHTAIATPGPDHRLHVRKAGLHLHDVAKSSVISINQYHYQGVNMVYWYIIGILFVYYWYIIGILYWYIIGI